MKTAHELQVGDTCHIRLGSSALPRLVRVVAISAGVLTLSGPTLPRPIELHHTQLDMVEPRRREERVRGGAVGHGWSKLGGGRG